MAYSDKVIDHYENPRNVGSFDKSDAHVGTGMVGAPAGGGAKMINFTAYKREVRKATYRSWYAMKREGNIPSNTGKRKDQYQLDHIVPFRQGYELGIDPKVIGGRKNLRWILGEENRQKWDRFQPEEIVKTILGE